MKKNILILIIILALISIIVILIDRAYRDKKDQNIITLYGNVDVRQGDIGFRASGQVNQLIFEEGDPVPEGTLISSIDDTPSERQLKEWFANSESIAPVLD